MFIQLVLNRPLNKNKKADGFTAFFNVSSHQLSLLSD